MEKRQLKCEKGVYYADIDITVSEWKEMLTNKNVFTKSSLEMLRYWYEQTDHLATNKEIMDKYHLNYKSSPFNGIVAALGKRIVKYLNRFEIIGIENKNTYFIIPFEGWHEEPNFVWKIRPELVQAIEELNIFEKMN